MSEGHSMAKKPLFALALAFYLGIDASGHLSSLHLRAQGMKSMWVTTPSPVPVAADVPTDGAQTWQFTESAPLLRFESRRPRWRCPVHGDIVSDISITVPGTDGPHHYCPRCLVELLDKMVLQVEEIPQAEEGTR